jgi:integrase
MHPSFQLTKFRLSLWAQGFGFKVMMTDVARASETVPRRHASGIEAGPIFRPIDKGGTVRDSRLTDRSVANIVKAYAARAGFDASTFSGHSLRAGFLTSAAGKGASIFKMMDVSRHKSVDTLRGYVRDAELFKDHAGTGLL